MAIVKSYIANTQKEAMNKVKYDLGSDAIIISTRKIRKKGLAGLFKKPVYEVTAVVDEMGGRSKSAVPQKEDIERLISETLKNHKLEQLEKQIENINEMVSKVYKNIDIIKNKELSEYSPEIQDIFDILVFNDIIQENAIRLIEEARSVMKKTDMDIKSAVNSVLHSYIGEPEPIDLSGGKKKIIIFIGPTGVGKTTTLAKVAAILSLKNEVKVGLITEDTYRIGAVEQLKIYADILELPLEIAYKPEEIKEIIDSMDDLDAILIDTAGRNPKDSVYQKNLKRIIELCGISEIHLVISATTGYSTAVKILESYSFIDNYKILFTKMDECEKWGIILNIKMKTNKPLSYITNGQNVAEDIMLADPKTISRKLLVREGVS